MRAAEDAAGDAMESGNSCRGDSVILPEIRSQILIESLGGNSNCSPLIILWPIVRGSAGSTPARWQNVAYQSAPWIYSSIFFPRCCKGNTPPDTNAATRTPPSQFETLEPF